MGVALSLVKVQFAGTTWHFFEDTTSQHVTKPNQHITPPHFFFWVFQKTFFGARNRTASTSTHGSRGGAGSTSNQPLRSLEAFRHMADLDLFWKSPAVTPSLKEGMLGSNELK